MANNVLKGKEFVFLVENDGATAYEIVGGVQTRSVSFNNPTEEITSSSTTSEYSEREYTGYSDCQMSVDGTADVRTGITDPVTSLNIVGFKRLAELATSGDRSGKFKMMSTNPALVEIIEGEFTITSLQQTGNTPGLLTFSATLESKADVTVSFVAPPV